MILHYGLAPASFGFASMPGAALSGTITAGIFATRKRPVLSSSPVLHTPVISPAAGVGAGLAEGAAPGFVAGFTGWFCAAVFFSSADFCGVCCARCFSW